MKLSHRPQSTTQTTTATATTTTTTTAKTTTAATTAATKPPPAPDGFSAGGSASPLASAPATVVSGLQVRLQASTASAEEMASAKLNAKVVKKYPKLLAICKDPVRLMADFTARFEAQKTKTPDDPYQFDVHDVVAGIVVDMADALKAEIDELTNKHAALKTKMESLGNVVLPWRTFQLAKMERGLAYFQQLHDDVKKQGDSGVMPYRTLQVLGFFTARALGIFDMGKIGAIDRALLQVDRLLQGYNGVNLDDEISRYQKKDFRVFDLQSPVGGFKRAHEPFEKAFFDPDRLRMISLPFADSIGPEPFTRLMPYNIFLTAMTREPAPADGFVRPGGDFWIHDVRHSSAIFEKREAYETAHGITPSQADRLRGVMDRWKVELDEARALIPDKELRYAIGFFMFNFHHDRGYPLAPSSYEAPEALNKVPRLLYLMLKISGQPTGFGDANKTLEKAFAWLGEFWAQRASEERSFWAQ